MLTLKAMKGAGWLVLSRFLGRLIDFFTLIVLARILTPADFGLTALAMTVVTSVDMVLEVPIIQALLRKQSFDDIDLNTGFTLSFLRSLIFGLIVVGAAWPIAHFYNDMRLVPLMGVLAIGPFVRGLVSPAMVRFARELSFRPAFTIEIIGKLVAFVSAITIVLLGGTYWAIAANSIVAVLTTVVISYWIAPYRPALSLARFKEFAAFTGWFSFNQVLAAINWQLDRILLGRFVDSATFGKYSIAGDMSAFPTQSVVGPAMQSVMAAFSSINLDIDRLRQAFLKAARFVMLISAPVCIGLSVTSDLVVGLVLGDKWLDAAVFLQILSLAVLPVPYYQVFYSLCLATDRPVFLFQIGMVEFLARLSLLPAGFYLMEITGVLYARLLIAALMFVVYILYIRRRFGITIVTQLANLWKVTLAAAAMATAVLFLRQSLLPLHLGRLSELLICAMIGAGSYILSLYALGIRFDFGGGRFGIRDLQR